MTAAGVPARRPRFEAVYLVCKACGKRGNGATKLTPKRLATLVRREAKGSNVRTRVVATTCLGLCPKKAVALARAADAAPLAIVAVRSKRQVAAAVAELNGPLP